MRISGLIATAALALGFVAARPASAATHSHAPLHHPSPIHQMAPGHTDGLSPQMQQLAAQLHLTPAQRAKTRSIQARTIAEMRATQTNRSLTPSQRQMRVQSILLSTQTQFVGMLTPAQRAKYQQLQAAQDQAAMKRMTSQQRAMLEQMMRQMSGGRRGR